MNTGNDMKTAACSIIMMKIGVYAFLWLTCTVLLVPGASSALSDRVVAFVDDQAITMSELDEQYRSATELSPDITVAEVLDTMINKILILREARTYRIEAPTPDQVMQEYINLKLRAFIRVGESDIETFYRENRAHFGAREFEEVRDEIDTYLVEKELNERLKEVLRELKRDAYIRNFIDR